MNRHLTLSIVCFFILILQAKSQGIIEFVENKGQWDSKVKYRGMLNSGAFFLRDGGFTVLQHNPNDIQALAEKVHGIRPETGQSKDGSVTVNSHSWNVDFIGASPQMRIAADKQVSSNNNYFIGDDPSKWASECKIYQGITMKNIYPNVDVRYYSNNGGMKYDIIVHPGGDLSRIAMKYSGADKLEIKNKELIIGTSVGNLKELNPYKNHRLTLTNLKAE